MKRLILQILLVGIVGMPCLAQQVNRQQALRQASQFLKRKGIKVMPNDMNIAYRGKSEKDTTTANYYAVNLPLRHGFVIIAGDARSDSVLAYSDVGEFKEKNMPEHIKGWLKRYSQQIDKLPPKPVSSSRPVSAASPNPAKPNDELKIERPSIAPMLKTQWDQDSPYNDLCPKADGSNCVTGCVATAMAQLMYFHQWPQDYTTPISNFYANNIQQAIPELSPTLFDWEDMKTKYKGSDKDDNAVATLFAYCANSIEMNYGPDNSSAYVRKVEKALKDNFGFCENVRHVRKKFDRYTDEEWEQLIYNELAEGRPVLLAGQSTGGGHAFVCDGYDADGLFHINWGWSGNCDGWFRLNVLNPENNSGIGASTTDDGYYQDQETIIGICPPNDRPVENTAYLTSLFKAANNGKLTASYYNQNSRKRFFRYGIGIKEDNGKIKPLKTFRSDEAMGENDKKVSVTYNLRELLNTPGQYQIVPISRQENHKTWRSGRSLAIATVDNQQKVTLQVINRRALKILNIKVPTNRKVGSKQNVRINLQNNYDNFRGHLYFFASQDESSMGKPWAATRVSVPGGETKWTSFPFRPHAAGEYTIWIATDKYGKNCIARTRLIIGQ